MPFVQDKRYIEQYYQLDQQKEALDVWGVSDRDKCRLPQITLTKEESSEYTKIMSDLNIYKDEAVLNFIVGNKPIEEFDSYVEEIKRLKIDRAIEIQHIMRTSFQTIPETLKEAAKIDGASHMMIFTKIVLPLSKTIIAVMVLYYGVEHWNAWFNAMIFLNNRDLFPLQLILREILLVNNTSHMVVGQTFADGIFLSETIKYAVVIVATVPILAVYPFLQKYFITGVMLGAVKE